MASICYCLLCKQEMSLPKAHMAIGCYAECNLYPRRGNPNVHYDICEGCGTKIVNTLEVETSTPPENETGPAILTDSGLYFVFAVFAKHLDINLLALDHSDA